MTRTPTWPPPHATRFFARVLSALFECPQCGTLYRFSAQESRRANNNANFDRRTSRFTCGECGLVLLFGLLAWPTERTRGSAAAPITLPRDQVPDVRQLAQLRAEGCGWWMTERKPKRRPDDTNVAGELGEAGEGEDRCTCEGISQEDLAKLTRGGLVRDVRVVRTLGESPAGTTGTSSTTGTSPPVPPARLANPTCPIHKWDPSLRREGLGELLEEADRLAGLAPELRVSRPDHVETAVQGLRKAQDEEDQWKS